MSEDDSHENWYPYVTPMRTCNENFIVSKSGLKLDNFESEYTFQLQRNHFGIAIPMYSSYRWPVEHFPQEQVDYYFRKRDGK